MGVVGHRHPGQHPIHPETPGVLHVVVEAEAGAMSLVDTPPDARLADPGGDGLQVVVGEAEPRTHGRGLGKVEDLARSGPAVGEGEYLGCHAEQRIGLHQRAVRQAHPEPVRRMPVAGHLTEPEPGHDQRCEGLDVGAHHQDVARLQRRVVDEQTQQHLTQHVDLASRAVAAVHLDRPVVVGAYPAVCTHRVGGDVGLQPAQQRVGSTLHAAHVLVLDCAVLRAGAGQAAAQFPQIPAQRRQQRMADVEVAAIVGAGDAAACSAELPPQRIAGVRQPQVQVVAGRQGLEELQIGDRQAGMAEQ